MPADASLNWQDLRPLNNSVQLAFEELCCQLAAYESVPKGSRFIRVGAPDAGVECYWMLPNGDELGWQAKFFRSSLADTQWQQLDDSVKTALQKHPRLVEYAICLPIGPPDARRPDQQSFQDKFNERIEKWKGWAKDLGVHRIEFNYWGEGTIWERLAREEHKGRLLLWFNRELFSQDWFRNAVEEAAENAEPQFDPALDVQLPISRVFDGLGRTVEFQERLVSLGRAISREFDELDRKLIETVDSAVSERLVQGHDLVIKAVSACDVQGSAPLPYGQIDLAARALGLACRDTRNSLRSWQEDVEAAARATGSEDTDELPESVRQKTYRSQHAQRVLYDLMGAADDLLEFLMQNEALVANVGALIVVGHAGTGKTHLLRQVAIRRIEQGMPTLLFLGRQFGHGDPWPQVIERLGLACSRDEFLAALETAASVSGGRALLLVDALNEGAGKEVWPSFLPGFLATIRRHPRLGFGGSVRTSYFDTVIPPGLVPSRLLRVNHHGFASHELEATERFFDNYGIERPTVPLMVPEFQNPLFLKLFCEGLVDAGRTRIQLGLGGITAILNFYMDALNTKLARPNSVSFNVRARLVQEAVQRLAAAMAERGAPWLPPGDAQAIVDAVHRRDAYEDSLFAHLLSEGLLIQDRLRLEGGEWSEGVRFAYERVMDHLIARRFLDQYLDPANPSAAFLPSKPLGNFLKDEIAAYWNEGILEALAVQLPERIGKELPDLAPHAERFRAVRKAFLQSLLWRHGQAFSDGTLSYINRVIRTTPDDESDFLDVLVAVAGVPEHPLNADVLHAHLWPLPMAERDAWWSIYFFDSYPEGRPTHRLVEWIRRPAHSQRLESEAARLSAMVITWMLTTSNRFLRDRATKALVSLLEGRFEILEQILRRFAGVNDPYVAERLFAVAYGCVMRGGSDPGLGRLAQAVYDLVFREGNPPPHILLRDYARGVIELAIARGAALEIEVEKIRPPYGSAWDEASIPDEAVSRALGEWHEGMSREESARATIYSSVVGWGDFARYVIGTNHGWFPRSGRRLGDAPIDTSHDRREAFARSLNPRQEQAWNEFLESRRAYQIAPLFGLIDRDDPDQQEERLAAARRILEEKEAKLRSALGEGKTHIFEEEIIPNLDAPSRHRLDPFDVAGFQRWIFARVLDLGWTSELFGEFDESLHCYRNMGREAHKPERIGKKYQWIAYHEGLARISDNFTYVGSSIEEQSERYDGPWQLTPGRDLDPSCLISTTLASDDADECWWFTERQDWSRQPDHLAWLRETESLPDLGKLLQVTDSGGRNWLTL
jgi:hypothetical protein